MEGGEGEHKPPPLSMEPSPLLACLTPPSIRSALLGGRSAGSAPGPWPPAGRGPEERYGEGLRDIEGLGAELFFMLH